MSEQLEKEALKIGLVGTERYIKCIQILKSEIKIAPTDFTFGEWDSKKFLVLNGCGQL